MSKDYEQLAELISELTRNCNIKEEYFAASFNLSPSEVRLLKLFSFSDTYTVKDLRDKLKLTPGRITHILSSLEAKKLLVRTVDKKDKRNIIVKLLPKSNPLIQNLQDSYYKLHIDILKNVTKKEIQNIYNSLTILADVFKKWVEEV